MKYIYISIVVFLFFIGGISYEKEQEKIIIGSNQALSETEKPDHINEIIGFGGLVVVLVQCIILARQTSFMSRQMLAAEVAANAAEATAKAALSSLDRPWLVLEDLKLNELDWLESKDVLVAEFRIKNYGKAPAVIKALKVTHFRGPDHHNGRPPFDLPNDVFDVPDEQNLGMFIWQRARSILRETKTTESQRSFTPIESTTLIVSSGNSTETFCVFGYRRLEEVEFLQPMGVTESYLIGHIFYEVPGQSSEVMTFCYKSGVRGIFDVFRDYPPYNIRKAA